MTVTPGTYSKDLFTVWTTDSLEVYWCLDNRAKKTRPEGL